MKKQKSSAINISEVTSSDDESQAKPKIDKEENTSKTVMMNLPKNKLLQNLPLKNQ